MEMDKECDNSEEKDKKCKDFISTETAICLNETENVTNDDVKITITPNKETEPESKSLDEKMLVCADIESNFSALNDQSDKCSENAKLNDHGVKIAATLKTTLPSPQIDIFER